MVKAYKRRKKKSRSPGLGRQEKRMRVNKVAQAIVKKLSHRIKPAEYVAQARADKLITRKGRAPPLIISAKVGQSKVHKLRVKGTSGGVSPAKHKGRRKHHRRSSATADLP